MIDFEKVYCLDQHILLYNLFLYYIEHKNEKDAVRFVNKS